MPDRESPSRTAVGDELPSARDRIGDEVVDRRRSDIYLLKIVADHSLVVANRGDSGVSQLPGENCVEVGIVLRAERTGGVAIAVGGTRARDNERDRKLCVGCNPKLLSLLERVGLALAGIVRVPGSVSVPLVIANGVSTTVFGGSVSIAR